MDCGKILRVTDYAHYLVCTLLFFGAFSFILIISTNPNHSMNPLSLFNGQNPPCITSPPTTEKHRLKMYRDKLEEALAGASTENNKTVIIAVVNKAYVDGDKSMLDMFLEGFWVGEGTRELVKHLLIVAVDQTSYERCTFLGLHCYKLGTDDVDFAGEKVFMSPDFLDMMWRRTQFLGDILKLGYSFIFTYALAKTRSVGRPRPDDYVLEFLHILYSGGAHCSDNDVIWLRNPFPRLRDLNETIDLQISTDNFNGDDRSESNPINTGFYMVRSNNRTIALFNSWYGLKNSSNGRKEQDLLNELISQGVIAKLGLKVKFLNTKFFSGFCQDSGDVKSVVTVHANCCRTITAKLADLTAVIHDWQRFKSFSGDANQTAAFHWSPHDRCIDSWNH
nr:Nucleotide-diphospho-sugar transferase protein [Ipomoea batatas]